MRPNFLLSSLILSSILLFACSQSSEGEGRTGESVEQADELAKTESLPKLLDLGSTTCIPCKKMAPILDSLEILYEGKAEIEFIDIKENKSAARDYGITLIPTQIFFDAKGDEVYRHIGFFPADSITAHLNEIGAVL